MKGRRRCFARIEPQTLWTAALGGCLLVSLTFIVTLRPGFHPFFFLNSQTSHGGKSLSTAQDLNELSFAPAPQPASSSSPPPQEERGATAAPPVQELNSSPPSDETRSTTPDEEFGAPSPSEDDSVFLRAEGSETSPEKEIVHCDYSHDRTDVCEISGETVIQGSSFSAIAVTEKNSSWRIRPYARKWETPLMPHIKEYTVRTEAAPPPCSRRHNVPAVVFSTGGLLGNFFHDLSDVLIPLYLTVHRFNGEVQFFVTQYNSAWFDKYGAVLRLLSNYKAIDGDKDGEFRCFPSATVGLWSHSELTINPNEYPADGISMTDFRRVLRRAYSLKREFPRRLSEGEKPKLLFLSRRSSRSMLNERKVMALARRVGFKVIAAPPEAVKNMAKFAQIVNSCDILMGVHGAGLTNMVFLPTNATMVQIIPWGELKYACRYSYGDPAVAMGMKYLEYEVGKEETSLKYKYPKNDPVFTDPLSIHRQGYAVVWDIFITHQNVSIDLGRFRPFLVKTLEFLRR